MATNTPKYGLKKPAGSDKYNVEDFNGNADILDLQLQNLKEEIDAKQPNIKGAASTIVDGNLLARRVLVSDASGKVGTSDITITEIDYLSGAKSNIQTQIDDKLGKSETAEKASADANGNNIVNTYATKVEVKSKASTTQLNEGLASKLGKTETAEKAIADSNGNNIISTYATKSDMTTKVNEINNELANKATTTQLNEGLANTTTQLNDGLATKQNKVTVSTSEPTSDDGVDGDLWAIPE